MLRGYRNIYQTPLSSQCSPLPGCNIATRKLFTCHLCSYKPGFCFYNLVYGPLSTKKDGEYFPCFSFSTYTTSWCQRYVCAKPTAGIVSYYYRYAFHCIYILSIGLQKSAFFSRHRLERNNVLCAFHRFSCCLQIHLRSFNVVGIIPSSIVPFMHRVYSLICFVFLYFYISRLFVVAHYVPVGI